MVGDTVQYQMDREGEVVAQVAVNRTGWSIDAVTRQSVLVLLMSRMSSFPKIALESYSVTGD